jgi:hypothetical protein
MFVTIFQSMAKKWRFNLWITLWINQSFLWISRRILWITYPLIKKLSTGNQAYPHFIHRVIHSKNDCNILIIKNKIKLSTENALPNNNNLY